jgi:hypothetical protein
MAGMRRVALVGVSAVLAGGTLFWPVDRDERMTMLGWTTGPDPNSHTATYRSGLAFRWLTVSHHWNLRDDRDGWRRQVTVRPLVFDLAVWAAATGAALLAASHRRRRRLAGRRDGSRRTCGYNLTGNTSGTCPKCGTPVPVGGGPRAADGEEVVPDCSNRRFRA